MLISTTKRVVALVSLSGMFVLSSVVGAQDRTQDEGSAAPPSEPSITAPELSDIIPEAVQLSTSFSNLPIELQGQIDVAAVEKSCSELEGLFEDLARQAKALLSLECK